MILNVLGSKYTCVCIDEPTPYMRDKELGGMCDYSSKTIQVVKKFYGELEKYEGEFMKSDSFIKETILHELAHAFLHESGQDDINTERTVEVMSKFCMFIAKCDF